MHPLANPEMHFLEGTDGVCGGLHHHVRSVSFIVCIRIPIISGLQSLSISLLRFMFSRILDERIYGISREQLHHQLTFLFPSMVELSLPTFLPH